MRKTKKRFEEVIAPYYPNVYLFIKSRTGDKELAKDLTQETFEKAWDKLNQLKNEDAARSWLFSIAVNVIKLYCRGQNAEKRALYDQVSFDAGTYEAEALERAVEETIIQKADGVNAIKALQVIKEEYRQVLWLRIIEQMSHAEIAGILGIKEETERTWYQRGLVRLREEYEKITGGEADE